MLKSYNCKFKKDLDELWTEHDIDENGSLDHIEAQPFLEEVAQVI